MFELFFVWLIAAAALGFFAILMVLMTRKMMAGLGRMVFLDTPNSSDVDGHSAA